MSTEIELAVQEIKTLFPYINYKDGNYYLFSKEQNETILLNEELMKLLSITEIQLKFLKETAKNEEYLKFIPNELRKEYCLLYAGRIMFHSPNRCDIENYKQQNKNILFVEYFPI